MVDNDNNILIHFEIYHVRALIKNTVFKRFKREMIRKTFRERRSRHSTTCAVQCATDRYVKEPRPSLVSIIKDCLF